jgi:hypothetical protein
MLAERVKRNFNNGLPRLNAPQPRNDSGDVKRLRIHDMAIRSTMIAAIILKKLTLRLFLSRSDACGLAKGLRNK